MQVGVGRAVGVGLHLGDGLVHPASFHGRSVRDRRSDLGWTGELPPTPPASAAPHAGAAPPGRRDPAVGVDDLVAPLFVREGIDEPQPIARCPASCSTPASRCARRSRELADLGVPGGDPVRRARAPRTPTGSEAWDPDGIVQVALRDLRDEVGDDMVLMADLCLDEYTDHGHCGVLDARRRGRQRRHPRAATPRSPSPRPTPAPTSWRPRGMMDGQVARHPRRARRRRATSDVAILAYAAKYASALYGPFRDAVDVDDRRRRRPQGLPAGLPQRPRGAGRGARSTSPRAPTW